MREAALLGYVSLLYIMLSVPRTQGPDHCYCALSLIVNNVEGCVMSASRIKSSFSYC